MIFFLNLTLVDTFLAPVVLDSVGDTKSSAMICKSEAILSAGLAPALHSIFCHYFQGQHHISLLQVRHIMGDTSFNLWPCYSFSGIAMEMKAVFSSYR